MRKAITPVLVAAILCTAVPVSAQCDHKCIDKNSKRAKKGIDRMIEVQKCKKAGGKNCGGKSKPGKTAPK